MSACNKDPVPIMGEDNMVQELPAAFEKGLEGQKKWNSRKSK